MSAELSDDPSDTTNVHRPAGAGGAPPSARTLDDLRRAFVRMAWCDQPVIRLRYLAPEDTLIAQILPLPGVREQYVHDRLCVHFDGDDAEALPTALCLTGFMAGLRSKAAEVARELLGATAWRRAIELAVGDEREVEVDLDGEGPDRIEVWTAFACRPRFGVGIEVMPGEVRGVLVDATGEVVAREVRRLHGMAPATVVAAVSDLSDALLNQAGGGPLVIGVQIGGPVDREQGLVHFYNKGSGQFDCHWSDVPLGELIEAATGAATLVLNDVEALATNERWFGLGATVDRYGVLLVSEGIGSALVVHGEIDTAMPMEIGNIVIHPGGRKCDCGNEGCVESTAGVRAIVERVGEESGQSASTLDEAAELAGSGDDHVRTMAEAVFRTAGQDLAIGIGSVQAIANPSAWVVYLPPALLDGGVAGTKFMSGLEEFGLWVSYEPYRQCDLHKRPLTDVQGAVGAGLAALERFGVSSPLAASSGGSRGVPAAPG